MRAIQLLEPHYTSSDSAILCVVCWSVCVCLCVVSMTLCIVSMSARCIVVAEQVRLGDAKFQCGHVGDAKFQCGHV